MPVLNKTVLKLLQGVPLGILLLSFIITPALAEFPDLSNLPAQSNHCVEDHTVMDELADKINLLEKERLRLQATTLIPDQNQLPITRSYEEGSRQRFLEGRISTLEKENKDLKEKLGNLTNQTKNNPAALPENVADADSLKQCKAQIELLKDENATLKKAALPAPKEIKPVTNADILWDPPIIAETPIPAPMEAVKSQADFTMSDHSTYSDLFKPLH